MVFSTNQTRQLYVVKKVCDTDTTPNMANIGDIFIGTDADGDVYGVYKGADGLIRTDLINKKNLISATATRYDTFQRGLGKWEIALNTSVNKGNPIAGQTYMVRINIKEWGGPGPDSQYGKYGIVRATSGMTTKDFYTKLKQSLVNNFSREPIPLFNFSLDSDGSPTKIIIEEIEQPWTLGIKESRPLMATITADPVTLDGDNVDSLQVKKVASTTIVGNGKKMADLEYFCMGERGDIYRGMGFPNIIKTTYLVDPTIDYNVIDISFYFQGDNEDSQKSNKQLIFVIPATGAAESNKIEVANALITKLNTALGITITALTAKA